ncbi:MAG: type II secretion system protein [Candidatus Nealsonbacteria bacterium]
MITKKEKSFTLIELLVVIAIIGLLSSVVLVSMQSTRGKARDARRKSDLRQIVSAIELYYVDHEHYPKEADGANGKVGEGAGLDAMLAPYMPVAPYDPLGPGSATYNYYYDGMQSCRDENGSMKLIAVIFARTLEEEPGNGSDFCASWGGEGGAGNSQAWHIVIGESSG